MPSFDERLQVELEKPKYEPLLANQYTPVVTSAMSVLATDAQYLSLAIPHPAQPITFGVSYPLGHGTGLVSLASTGYQYQHNLYGTTKADAEIAAATTLVGAIHMAVMVHIGFLYTVLRTFGAIPSP